MSKIPTRWATVEAGWGSGNAHIYSLNESDVSYHKTEAGAREEAMTMLRDGVKMVAIMEIKALLVPAIEATEIT